VAFRIAPALFLAFFAACEGTECERLFPGEYGGTVESISEDCPEFPVESMLAVEISQDGLAYQEECASGCSCSALGSTDCERTEEIVCEEATLRCSGTTTGRTTFELFCTVTDPDHQDGCEYLVFYSKRPLRCSGFQCLLGETYGKLRRTH